VTVYKYTVRGEFSLFAFGTEPIFKDFLCMELKNSLFRNYTFEKIWLRFSDPLFVKCERLKWLESKIKGVLDESKMHFVQDFIDLFRS
jgi:hypothetical protein